MWTTANKLSGLSRACALMIVLGVGLPTTSSYGQDDRDNKLTVAILEFEDTSPKNEFARLNRALQSMLTTDLSVSRDMTLVERARLQDVRTELNLVKTGFLDPKTAAKVGKGVGAKAVLTGSFWIRNDKMRIDARLVHVESGTVLLAAEITGSANDFTGLEKQLAKKVLDAVDIRLSALESADLSKRHTSSLLAASRYGRALVAEDAGDLDDARQNAAAALKTDPDFDLAQRLLKQISQLLDRAQKKAFQQKVFSIVQFEDSLNGHPFAHPRFKPDKYPKLLRDEGAKRALFYWISYLGGKGPARFSSATVGLPPQASPFNSMSVYLELGGAEPVMFWCDVVTSDPKYAPSKPLTEAMLYPNRFQRPIWGPYPPNYFHQLPDVYDKRFQAQAWIQGDFEDALQSLEAAHTICRPLMSEDKYLRQLEELKEIMSSPHQLASKRREGRERQRLWQLAHDQIVEHHVSLQNSRFRQSQEPTQKPNDDEVRRKLILEYAGTLRMGIGDRAAQERQTQRLVDGLVKEAAGSAFVARKTPLLEDFTGLGYDGVVDADKKPILIEVMHLSGCPYSYLSMNARMAAKLPLPTAVNPSVDNLLTTSDDPQDGIKKGWIPCPHCRPLRWAKSDAVEDYLAERLPAVIGDFVDKGSEVAKAKLTNLLTAFQDHPTPKAHESLRRLCQHVCKESSGDRKLHAVALQSMARFATRDDASWLIGVLETTPWWDVRINVAAAMASVDDDKVSKALQRATEREPYYFVRHSLEAALARSRERAILARIHVVGSQWDEGHIAEAHRTLENLLDDIVADKSLPRPILQYWECHAHWHLGRLCDQLDDVDGQIKHLRRCVEIKPDNPTYKNELGYLLAAHDRDLKEAEQLLRDAISLDRQQKQIEGKSASDNPFYCDSLGFVLFKQGRHDEAKKLVQKCLDSPEGQRIDHWDHLGDICWALGEKDQAIDAWKKAVQVAKDTPFEKDLKAQVIEKLKKRNAQ